MKYKKSMYNYCLEDNNMVIIHNSMSGKNKKYPNITEVYKILQTPNDYVNTPLFNDLYENNFIVDSCIEENTINRLKYFDKVADRKLTITILPTEQCNFRCQYCYENFKNGKMSIENQNTIIKWISRNIGSYSGLEIKWYGGEPLLEIDMIEELSQKMISICKKRYIPYSSSITTNGSLLNAETFKRLLACRVTLFQITMDGSAKHHNVMRPFADGSGSYEKILNNLKNIRDEIKTQSFKILIRSNISHENLQDIEEHLKVMYEEFHEDNRFMFYFRPVGNWGGNRVNKIKSELVNGFDEIYTPILNSKYTLCYFPYIELLNDGMCDAIKRNSFVIGADGTIYKCTMLLENDQNKIGKIKDGDFIFDQQKLSKWVCEDFKTDPCKDCPHTPACNKRTCAIKGFLTPETGKCGYENTSIEYTLKLLNKSYYKNKPIISTYKMEA